MPTYTIKDNDKNEYFDTICSYNQLQEFLEENPHCNKVITAPAIVSGNGVKSDGGFKETMSRIAEGHPNSPLAERYGNKGTHKNIKVKEIAKKHKLVDVGGHNVTKHYEKNKATGLY
jgi:hypothetical protein